MPSSSYITAIANAHYRRYRSHASQGRTPRHAPDLATNATTRMPSPFDAVDDARSASHEITGQAATRCYHRLYPVFPIISHGLVTKSPLLQFAANANKRRRLRAPTRNLLLRHGCRHIAAKYGAVPHGVAYITVLVRPHSTEIKVIVVDAVLVARPSRCVRRPSVPCHAMPCPSYCIPRYPSAVTVHMTTRDPIKNAHLTPAPSRATSSLVYPALPIGLGVKGSRCSLILPP